MAELKVPAGWAPDCQGKWDYDGRLVTLSTRYWPANYQQNGMCSAKSSIYLGSTQDAHLDDAVPLIVKEFEAHTEAEVKRMVEVWVAEQYARIGGALATVLGVNTDGGKSNDV